MNSAHLESLELLQKARESTLYLVRDLTQRQSDYSPSRGKWSIGEVLDHLLLAEKLYRDSIGTLIDLEKAGRMPVISKSFSDIDTSIAFIPKAALPLLELPFTLLNVFVPPVVRETMATLRILPAQNPKIAEPTAHKPIDDLRAALRDSINSTSNLLKSNPQIDFRNLRYRHPLLGDNNVPQLLRIVAFHEQRHLQQIRDILKSRTFPQAA